mmetsp:Transcript_24696/g.68737  ORF Transcript_24696/g.68737 Transcript_24696/m.68737 type:complete len:238 (-) Transcript_24696:4596-5309(-)
MAARRWAARAGSTAAGSCRTASTRRGRRAAADEGEEAHCALRSTASDSRQAPPGPTRSCGDTVLPAGDVTSSTVSQLLQVDGWWRKTATQSRSRAADAAAPFCCPPRSLWEATAVSALWAPGSFTCSSRATRRVRVAQEERCIAWLAAAAAMAARQDLPGRSTALTTSCSSRGPPASGSSNSTASSRRPARSGASFAPSLGEALSAPSSSSASATALCISAAASPQSTPRGVPSRAA